ncbi:hypothetical protein LJC08_01565 [Methanimicrococcus sp. OttesenSCG-928-J09]|nr:hypothetical protein [Methanimicrococcus sp. OttesenSCG-928-J09]
MQTPFEHGDKMEVCLFEKKELFYITKITEYRDGAGFPFKSIEIDRVPRPKAAPQVQPKKENPALTVNMGRLPQNQIGSTQKQLGSGTRQIPAPKAQPKTVAASGTKQVSANAAKKLAAQDVAFLPSGKKK